MATAAALQTYNPRLHHLGLKDGELITIPRKMSVMDQFLHLFGKGPFGGVDWNPSRVVSHLCQNKATLQESPEVWEKVQGIANRCGPLSDLLPAISERLGVLIFEWEAREPILYARFYADGHTVPLTSSHATLEYHQQTIPLIWHNRLTVQALKVYLASHCGCFIELTDQHGAILPLNQILSREDMATLRIRMNAPNITRQSVRKDLLRNPQTA